MLCFSKLFLHKKKINLDNVEIYLSSTSISIRSLLGHCLTMMGLHATIGHNMFMYVFATLAKQL